MAPRSRKEVIITSTRSVIDVPYIATVIPEFFDGTTGTPYVYSGTFEGVPVNNIKVVYEDDAPLFDDGTESRDTRQADADTGIPAPPSRVRSGVEKIVQSILTLFVCFLLSIIV